MHSMQTGFLSRQLYEDQDTWDTWRIHYVLCIVPNLLYHICGIVPISVCMHIPWDWGLPKLARILTIMNLICL